MTATRRLPAVRPRRTVLGYTARDWRLILAHWLLSGPAIGVVVGVALMLGLNGGQHPDTRPVPAGAPAATTAVILPPATVRHDE